MRRDLDREEIQQCLVYDTLAQAMFINYARKQSVFTMRTVTRNKHG
jgi:hypothetical protein